MNLEQVTAIIEAFKARVGEQLELLYVHPVIGGTIPGVKHGALSIFDGPDGDSQKIASLGYEGNGEVFQATLIIGWNEFKFIETPELCVEMINRFVVVPQKQSPLLTSSHV
jgi:hypothetical protein